jgi:hypothetical protein
MHSASERRQGGKHLAQMRWARAVSAAGYLAGESSKDSSANDRCTGSCSCDRSTPVKPSDSGVGSEGPGGLLKCRPGGDTITGADSWSECPPGLEPVSSSESAQETHGRCLSDANQPVRRACLPIGDPRGDSAKASPLGSRSR